jgi:aminoglycoside 6-adenylyltransferase
MDTVLNDDPVIRRLVQWGEARDAVRAMILTSSRTNPSAPRDVFSDYDVILVVTDIHPFFEDRSFLNDLGKKLVVYRDPIGYDFGIERFAYITQYEDGTKIDYIFYPLEMVRRIVAEPELPADFDLGYAVLFDKDYLTAGLKPPTHCAYIPTPPTEEEYLALVESIFHEATYVAKHLWRDDLIPAKYNLDLMMKHECLRPLLDWHMEIANHWAVKTGAYGKGLKKRTRPDIWADLEKTYVGADLEDNWDALFRTIDLFRRVAVEVGQHLGYDYPYALDQRAVAYLRRVQNLDRGATKFPWTVEE